MHLLFEEHGFINQTKCVAVLVCHVMQQTSQSSALAVGDLAVKLIHRDFNVRLTLGDGAL